MHHADGDRQVGGPITARRKLAAGPLYTRSRASHDPARQRWPPAPQSEKPV